VPAPGARFTGTQPIQALMDPSLAPMIVMVTAILTAGGVAVFRPLVRRRAALEAPPREPRLPDGDAEIALLRETVSSLEARLARMEERQDFAEALLSGGPGAPKALGRPG